MRSQLGVREGLLEESGRSRHINDIPISPAGSPVRERTRHRDKAFKEEAQVRHPLYLFPELLEFVACIVEMTAVLDAQIFKAVATR